MNSFFHDTVNSFIEQVSLPNFAWQNNNQELLIPKGSPQGFDIHLGMEENSISVFTDVGFHYHEDFHKPENHEAALFSCLGLVRDLLSPHMRIVQTCSNKKPRKWIVEQFVDGTWMPLYENGLLFWNYFGKKSERIFVNDTLPPRKQG